MIFFFFSWFSKWIYQCRSHTDLWRNIHICEGFHWFIAFDVGVFCFDGVMMLRLRGFWHKLRPPGAKCTQPRKHSPSKVCLCLEFHLVSYHQLFLVKSKSQTRVVKVYLLFIDLWVVYKLLLFSLYMLTAYNKCIKTL